LTEPLSPQAAAMLTTGFAAAAPPARSRRTTMVVGAAAVIFAALAAWGWMRRAPEPPLARYALYLRPDETLAPALANNSTGRMALSPDGSKLVYVGHGGGGNVQLYLKNRVDVRPTPISGTDGAYNPFFSPDGRNIGFIINGNVVRVLPLEGGAALTLTDKANTSGGAWGDDGYIYFETDSGIARIRAGGGATEPVYQLSAKDKEVGAEFPSVLPGATGIIFRVRATGQSPAEFNVVGVPLPHGAPKVLTHGVFATYASSGHLVVVSSDGKLIAFPFDAKKLEITGPPVGLYENLEARPFAAPVALSKTGTLIFATASTSALRDVVTVTREGLARQVDPAWAPQGAITSLRLSPDGKRLAVTVVKGAQADVWVKELPAGPFLKITFGDSAYSRPQWSSDGKSVLFIGGPDVSGGAPFSKPANGVGDLKLLYRGTMNFGEVAQSPDGKWLLLRRVLGETGNGDIFALKAGDTALVPLVATPAREGTMSVSPNGKWLAYVSDESGAFEVYVRPFPNVGSARWQVSTAGGVDPMWAHNGRELFFRDGKDQLVAASYRESPEFSVTQQKVLFPLTAYPRSGALPGYDPAPDDRSFYMLRETSATEPSELIVTEHWFGELKARTAQK
ncbi:MAG TPA: LpqB family beta-propeller domain-containing protein, partial [Gemmatimonadaceae bacterium]|nr:LpqB family beta-propeller domain-containing protein [Gemmatimonadaceae bacterium]